MARMRAPLTDSARTRVHSKNPIKNTRNALQDSQVLSRATDDAEGEPPSLSFESTSAPRSEKNARASKLVTSVSVQVWTRPGPSTRVHHRALCLRHRNSIFLEA